jgi:hypothetical protein
LPKQLISNLAVEIGLEADEAEASAAGVSDELLDAIHHGWQATYALLFGQAFIDSMGDHHKEAVVWHWESRLAFLENRRPDYLAYFPIWPRGHLKSTLAEHMVVIDAVLSVAFAQPGFALYIGREHKKVQENISNIENLLCSPAIIDNAPALSKVARNEETNRKKEWTATFLFTAGGYVVKAGTTDSAQAGSRIGQTRPTLIVPDDIDGREDSAVITKKRLKRLTGEILPMRQSNTLVYFAQNLISRYSVMYQIHKQKVRVLTNRKPTKEVPAVINPVFGRRTVGGIVQDYLISGKTTWHVWDHARINDEIQTYGLEAFKAECQHDVDTAHIGLFHKAYDDEVHPISYSQFASVYGARDAWKNWFKVAFSDWARTKTKYHANIGGYLAVSNQNTTPSGFTFLIPFSFRADAQVVDVAERFLTELTPYAYGENGNRKTWHDLIEEAWKRTNAQQHFKDLSERMAFEANYYSRLIPKYSRKVLSAYRVGPSVNSHSEDKVRDMLNTGFGFRFQPSNPGKTEALEEIDQAMRVDYESDHAFKPGVKGYTRWYVLCPDDTTKQAEVINDVEVYPPAPYPDALEPDELQDSDLFRYQMCNRKFKEPKLTEGGETIDEPEKTNDDFGQGLQMVYLKGLLRNIVMTANEKAQAEINATMPPEFLEEVKASPNDSYKSHVLSQRDIIADEIKRKLKEQRVAKPSWRKIG